MASKTLLDRLELPLAQCIDVEDRRALVRHAVHGLDGDVLQQMGRRAARVAITGVVAGPDARGGLEALREKSRSAQPVDFVADVATATGVTRVVIERWDVRELSGRPDRWQYAFLLREHLDPPASTKTETPTTTTTTSTAAPTATETGTLVVEVTVEGEPDFDMGRVAVTATAGGVRRDMGNRAGNTWTDGAAPLGPHTVEATVADPPMAGTEQGTVNAGQTTPLRIVLRPTAAVARMFMVSFRFDSAFVEPCMRAQLRHAAAFARARPSQKVVVVGHTDRTGPGPYNQSLSERRARTVFAALNFGTGTAAADAAVAEWTAIRQQRTVASPTEKETGGWGAREYQQMLQELRFYPGRIDAVHGPLTDEAVRAFRCQHGLPPGTTVDDAVWSALIRAYLADDPPTVPSAQHLPNCATTVLEWLGCGEEDPVLNTQSAHRPNRRVELLLTTALRVPCAVPVPDTWGLPEPGRAAGEWCLGGDGASRTCFATRTPPAAAPRWLIQDAEPGTVTVQGLIEREVEDVATGVVTRVPAANLSIVLITPKGEFLAGETGSGNGTPARTDAAGRFSFPGKTPGVYALEIQESVLARPAADGDAAARGPTVRGVIPATGGTLDVLILRDPVLREIRLPVIVHRMTALHPGTREVRTCPDPLTLGGAVEQRTSRDAAAARTLLRETNVIWGRARIRFEVRSVIDEAFATAGRDECAVDRAEFGDVLVESATPNVVNVYLFGTLASSGTAGTHAVAAVQDGAGNTVRRAEGVGVGDRVLLTLFAGVDPVPVQPGPADLPVILGHVLGLGLGLPQVAGTGPQAQNRLMLQQHAPTNRRLVQAEVAAARAAPNARDCIPLRLEVTGAVRFGGPLGHRFAAIRDATAAPVSVREVFPPHLVAAPGSSVTTRGGTIDPATGAVTVSRAGPVRQEIVARHDPGSAGGAPLETHVVIYVFDFDVDVVGARRLAPAPATRFYAIRGAAALTARAVLFPDPPVVPGDLATWGPVGTAHPDPLRRRMPRAAAGAVSLPVTVAGVTRTIELTVAEDFRLEVPDAVRLGPGRFLAVIDPARTVTIRAVLNPAPDPLPADLITWGGTRPTIAVSPVERTMARTAPSGAFTVTATIGDVTHSVTIELVTMSLRIDGALNPGPPNVIEFYAPVHPTATATAVLELAPPPSVPLPAGSVVWDPPALAGPDPLRGTLSRATAVRTLVRATLTGTTRPANFNVYTLSFVSAAIVPAAPAPALARVQIEGLLDTALASVDRADLFGTQPDSLFRLRADMPAGAPAPATLPHRLVSRTGVGVPTDIEPLDLTLTATGGVARLQSLPMLAVPRGLPRAAITLAAVPDILVLRAQAGGRVRVDGVPTPEVRVRGRVVHIAAQIFTGSAGTETFVRTRITTADRIWSQAGVEVRERSIQPNVVPPAGLLDLDVIRPFTGVLSDEERRLLGLDAGGPTRSPVANDMNVYVIHRFVNPDPTQPQPVTLGGVAYARESFRAIDEPAHSAIAMKGSNLRQPLIAHELGHHLLRGWRGNEHQDTATPQVDWPQQNVMHDTVFSHSTGIVQAQAQNVLDATAGDDHPVIRWVE